MPNVICHLVYRFNIGGLEKLLLELVQDSHQQFSHHIICLTDASPAMTQQLPPNVKVHSLHKSEGHSLNIYFALYKLLKKISPTTLHSYNLPTIEYQWLAWLLNIKHRIHAEHGRDSYDPTGSLLKYRLLRRLCSWVIPHFVTVSDELKQWLTEEIGISYRKILVIKNGVNTDYFQPQSSTNNTRFTIGHVARLQAIKNQTLLLQAYELACSEHQDFKDNSQLIIVGDGPEYHRLTQQAEQLACAHNITFAGAKIDVKPYYQQFDIFVLSSIAEGIPMTLLEAMSMQVATLSTEVGGISEVIQPRYNGHMVASEQVTPLAKAMLLLFEDTDYRITLANNSRKTVKEHYNKTNVLERYYQLYQSQ